MIKLQLFNMKASNKRPNAHVKWLKLVPNRVLIIIVIVIDFIISFGVISESQNNAFRKLSLYNVFDFILCFSTNLSSEAWNLQLISQLLLFDAQQQHKVLKPSFSNIENSKLEKLNIWSTLIGPHTAIHRRRKYGRCSQNSLRAISYFGSIWE